MLGLYHWMFKVFRTSSLWKTRRWNVALTLCYISVLTSKVITNNLRLIIVSISKWVFLSSFFYYNTVNFVTQSLWSYSCIESNTIKSEVSFLQFSLTLWLKPDCACTQNLLNLTKLRRETYSFGQHSQKISLLHSCCCYRKPNYYSFFRFRDCEDTLLEKNNVHFFP